MPNLEEAIRERAYHLWIADGQPEGQADVHWLNAQREVLTMSVGNSGGEVEASVSAKPAKKAKAARTSRTRAA